MNEYKKSAVAKEPARIVLPEPLEKMAFNIAKSWDAVPESLNQIAGICELKSAFEDILAQMHQGSGFVILAMGPDCLSSLEAMSWLFACLLGCPLEQNKEGARIVHVFDRDSKRSMRDGARYHQTHHGGSIHTDNVNLAENWNYLVFSCISNAKLGGESIFVDGKTVSEALFRKVPEAHNILRENFWFDARGFEVNQYSAPVLYILPDGEVKFRYLRDYIEAAHNRLNAPLTNDQVWALDALDAVLEDSQFQQRTMLSPGEIAISLDSRVLHGRTVFVDDRNGEIRRMCRIWVQ